LINVQNSEKDPIFQRIPETKKSYEYIRISMQRKIYRSTKKDSVRDHSRIDHG